jgi:hypothetical protein
MNAEVPGGQLVYITPHGRLKYTQAHSAGHSPPSSTLTGFTLKSPVTRGFGQLLWGAPGAPGGFMACPGPNVEGGDNEVLAEGGWAVYARTAGFVERKGCVGVDLAVPMVTETEDFGVRGVEAWQYT